MYKNTPINKTTITTKLAEPTPTKVDTWDFFAISSAESVKIKYLLKFRVQ